MNECEEEMHISQVLSNGGPELCLGVFDVLMSLPGKVFAQILLALSLSMESFRIQGQGVMYLKSWLELLGS